MYDRGFSHALRTLAQGRYEGGRSRFTPALSLPMPVLQILVRARHALGACEVLTATERDEKGKKKKSPKRRVSVEEARDKSYKNQEMCCAAW